MPNNRPSGRIFGGLSRIGGGTARLWAVVALFSLVANLALLTGPLFMLAVYDRVLPAGSTGALARYGGLAAVFYLGTGVIDLIRGRIATRLAARIDIALAPVVLRDRLAGGQVEPASLDALQRLMTAPALAALFDLPFAPLFLGAIFIADRWLGLASAGGAIVILVLGLANHSGARRPLAAAAVSGAVAQQFAMAALAEHDSLRAMRMETGAAQRWAMLRRNAAVDALAAADHVLGHAAVGRVGRMALQSGLLAVGALLVMAGAISGGAMIVASVLLGRALAPVETLIAQWPVVAGAMAALQALDGLPAGPPIRRAAIMTQDEGLVVRGLWVAQALRDLSFAVGRGQALGVIGPSGAGKSTLLRVLSGALVAETGRVTLGGVRAENLRVGYLPQAARLLPGSIAQNVARFGDDGPAPIWRALSEAGADTFLRSLPAGLATEVGEGVALSGGQIQRIALARALFSTPDLLVLDEPNAHLDGAGLMALNAAVAAAKARGAVVIIAAHHRSALMTCDLALAIEDGALRAFGPREAVLAALDSAQPVRAAVG